MKREITRVEPLSTYLERWKAPASAVSRHGDTVYVSGLPATSSPRSIGIPAALPTRIWICGSKSNGTFVEATVRYAAELGYEVTVVKDATASYSDEHMHAALDVNVLNYASAIVTTNEVVAAIASPAGVEVTAGPDPRIETPMVSRFLCEG
jgi:hypothetical protein